MSIKEIVEVDKAEYDQLVKDSMMLAALERGGVDNWEWHGEAMRDYHHALKEAGIPDPDWDDDEECEDGKEYCTKGEE